MPSISINAPAKLNLTLDVLARRPDGYHDMKMVMASVSLADTLTLNVEPGEGLELAANLAFLPADGRNLAVKAAQIFLETTGITPGRLSIYIHKVIPVCAGMGGGSSDAAAVLRGLNEFLHDPLSPEELRKVGEQVGSDVPYCVQGGTALAEGKGELLTPLTPLPQCWVVIAKPAFSISTPELFRQLDGKRIRCRPDTDGVLKALAEGDLPGVARRLFNVFEEALPLRRRNRVEELKQILFNCGALGASMTGTGPTVFGLFDEKERARAACEEVKMGCDYVFLERTLNPSDPV